MNNKIKLRTPGYYKNFHCISSECKDNCCVGGWQIDICEVPLENTKQIPSYPKIQGYA